MAFNSASVIRAAHANHCNRMADLASQFVTGPAELLSAPSWRPA